MSAPRIAPEEPPYRPDVAAELERWMPRGAAVEPLRLFRTLARDLRLAGAMGGLGRHLLGRRLPLGMRERELVIDRVCARCGCEYEWGVHVAAFADAAGLSEEETRATLRPVEAHPWSERDALLLRLVDELHDTSAVSDELAAALGKHYAPEALLELLVLVGWYHLISFVANGAGVEREPWAVRFAEPRPQ